MELLLKLLILNFEMHMKSYQNTKRLYRIKRLRTPAVREAYRTLLSVKCSVITKLVSGSFGNEKLLPTVQTNSINKHICLLYNPFRLILYKFKILTTEIMNISD